MSGEDRLEKLEKHRRRVNVVLVAIGVVVLCVAASVVSRERQTDVLSARMVELVDQDGRTRVALGLAEGVAALGFTDEKGRVRGGLTLTPHGFALGFVDERGQKRVELSLTDQGPRLAFFDKAAVERVLLSLDGDSSGLALNDKQGENRVTIGLSEQEGEGPLVALADGAGRIRAGLCVAQAGPMLVLSAEAPEEFLRLNAGAAGTQLGFFDKNGVSRVAIGLSEKEGEGPLLALADGAGRTRAGLSVAETGPQLKFFDKEGVLRVNLARSADASELAFNDENADACVGLTLARETAGLVLRTEQGQQHGTLAVTDNAYLGFFDGEGNVVWSAP